MLTAVILPFLGVALLYSAAGLGGGSSYLAVLALAEIDYLLLRPIALLCNLAVVSGSIVIHMREQNLHARRSFPFVIFSIPAAFIAGTIRLDERIYFIVLGAALVVAGAAMIVRLVSARRVAVRPGGTPPDATRGEAALAMAVGAGIGFLSGLVGIGGGIFLSPILHLSDWARPKEIAATTSGFIAVNSAAGLLGQLTMGWPSEAFSGQLPSVLALLAAVILGGQIGSRLTARRLGPNVIRVLTAALVVFVGVKIMIENV